jgi:hypothetical protein
MKIIFTLLIAANVAAAAETAPKPKPAKPEDLSIALAKLRRAHEGRMRETVMDGGAEELRDAISSGERRLANRLPGMARDPFHVCRKLEECKRAPVVMHVEDQILTDAAFMALARPWFALQEKRGKAVHLTVDPGAGVKLELEDFPAFPAVTLSAEPTPTGGFDVSIENGEKAAKAFAEARAAALAAK